MKLQEKTHDKKSIDTFPTFPRKHFFLVFLWSALPFQTFGSPQIHDLGLWLWSIYHDGLSAGQTFCQWKDLQKHQVTQPFPVALLCIGTDPAQFRTKKVAPTVRRVQLKLTFLDYCGYATFGEHRRQVKNSSC